MLSTNDGQEHRAQTDLNFARLIFLFKISFINFMLSVITDIILDALFLVNINPIQLFRCLNKWQFGKLFTAAVQDGFFISLCLVAEGIGILMGWLWDPPWSHSGEYTDVIP